MSQNHLFILFMIVSIPIALGLWFMNNLASNFFGVTVLSPVRWLCALVIPVLFAKWGLQRKSVDISGAISGYFVGFLVTLGNYCFVVCLFLFFVSSSKATKYKSHLKKKMEEDHKEGGERNWAQVLSNGLVASIISFIYIIECGCRESVLDIDDNYLCSLLCFALIGTFSCCNGDTWASELGPVFQLGDPLLITSLKRVPRGTNGGVSGAGLFFSFLGGLVIGLCYYIVNYLMTPSVIFSATCPQWPIIAAGACGGLLGSIIDSVLGATLQYSGITKDGRIVQHSGKGITHISGIELLDNDSINLISSLLTAILIPYIVVCIF